MNYRGVVFFDYDGTLSDEKAGIFAPTEASCRAIRALSDNGYLAVLATGRAKCYVPQTNAAFDGYVTTNGAYAEIRGQKIHEEFLNRAQLLQLVDAMDALGMYYSLENQDACYAKDMDYPAFRRMLDNFKIPLDIFHPLSELREMNTSKLLMVYDAEWKFEQLSEQFRGIFGIYKHRFSQSADINAAGMTKAVGAEAIIRRFDIPIEHTYAIGDGSNDYDILKLVGHGVVMEKHAACLDEIAELVTADVGDEGVYQALKTYHLI